ncbi:Cut9-interacting protein scn1 [Sporothrix eucalyptigena]|uniref:Cut9-interacting protein scn1 n=1 Tax=Sporothrix eucalyptigena TaxID=1812306 RepID=A0ABP0BXJ3_9PEZI
MCNDHVAPPQAAVALVDDPNAAEPFPWASGRVYDAHCHPTDTMASLPAIPGMGAATLTVMSTRAQDQALVAQLGKDEQKVVPAFGWHPWFSYQLYDDSRNTNRGDLVSMDDKRKHLAAVLLPSPPSLDASKEMSEKDQQLLTALDALAASLPVIRPISAFIAETRQRLLEHPTALVGEIGIDKAFRVPEAATTNPETSSSLTPGGREGRRLSPFRVQPAHQTAVLAAQLKLAAQLQRPVSVHGVQAHGVLFSTLAATWRGHERKLLSHRERHQIANIPGLDDEESSDEEDGGQTKPYPPAICLHSFSGPVDMLQQYLNPKIPAVIYFSISTAVNYSTESGCQRTAEVLAACPDDRLLVESDLHVAGAAIDAALEDMYRRVCAIKKWTLAEGVDKIGQNYDAFILKTKRTRRRR